MKSNKKHVLRAPPRSVELISTLDSIKVNRQLGEQKHYFYVRITLIITDIITLILGVYILVNRNYFLDENYNFESHRLLLAFVYIYSPSAIGIFIVSFILSLLVYTFYWCFQKEKIHGAPLYDEKDIITMSITNPKDYKESLNKKPNNKVKLKSSNKSRNKYYENQNNENQNNENQNNENQSNENKNIESEKSENKNDENNKKDKVPQIEEEYIGINADKVTLFPYTVTIFVIMTITFYFIALPLSIILLVKLLKDKVYGSVFDYFSLYVFIFANFVNGILIVVVFIHMFIVKRKENNILKKNMDINESKIRNYRNEVAQALKNVN